MEKRTGACKYPKIKCDKMHLPDMTKSFYSIRMNYTYIVRCQDNTLYTGWTTDLKKRLKAHNEKKGAKYTKNRTPVTLVYYEEYETKQEAMKREYAIKQLSRAEKLELIEQQDITEGNM